MTFPPDPRPPLTPERVREIAAKIENSCGYDNIYQDDGESALGMYVMRTHELRDTLTLARAFLSQPKTVQRRVLRRIAYDDAQKDTANA